MRKQNPDCPICKNNKRVIFRKFKKFQKKGNVLNWYQCEVYVCNACYFVIDPSDGLE